MTVIEGLVVAFNPDEYIPGVTKLAAIWKLRAVPPVTFKIKALLISVTAFAVESVVID